MQLTITLGDITRTYNVDDTDIINNDWNGIISDMLDTVETV